MAKQIVNYTHTVDVTDTLFAMPESVFNAVVLRSQSAFSSMVPDMLVEYDETVTEPRVVDMGNGQAAIENRNGTRFKVVCSKTGRFNVAPSVNKGAGRADCANVKAELKRQGFTYVTLVNTENPFELMAVSVRIDDLTGGIVYGNAPDELFKG